MNVPAAPILERRRLAMPALPRGWAALILLGAAALVATPLASLILIAASGSGSVELWTHLARYVLAPALVETATLLVGVAIIAGVAGVGTAWAVTLYRFPGRGVLVWLLPLPLAVPTYITAYVYGDLLDTLGPVQSALRALTGIERRADYWFPEIRSTGGAVFVIGFVVYPYVYLAARSMFATQSACLAEVARTLGSGPISLFTNVAMPLARPALAVGLALALLETLNDIGASEYLGVQTLTLSIASTWLNRGSLAGAAQIALFMLAIVAGLLWLEAHGRRGQRFHASTKRPRSASPILVEGGRGWLVTLACAVPILFGLAIPGGFLLLRVFERGLLSRIDNAFVSALISTLGFSAAATLIVMGIGLMVALAARHARNAVGNALAQIAGLGYAVPGTVLALALLTPVVAFDRMTDQTARALFGTGTGLLLAGSGAAIVLAYVVRFLPIATGGIGAGLTRVSASIDDAASTLGAAPGYIARRIHLPLARPALAGAALLVFIDCLKELPATLILRPLNVDTLATQVYAKASAGQFEEGALAALAIMLAGLYPALRMARMPDTAQRI